VVVVHCCLSEVAVIFTPVHICRVVAEIILPAVAEEVIMRGGGGWSTGFSGGGGGGSFILWLRLLIS
jgi:hypothetical protein